MLKLSVCSNCDTATTPGAAWTGGGPGKEGVELHGCPRLVWKPQIHQVSENSFWEPELGERAKRSCVSVLVTNLICSHLLLDPLLPISFPPVLFFLPPQGARCRGLGWAGQELWVRDTLGKSHPSPSSHSSCLKWPHTRLLQRPGITPIPEGAKTPL